MGDWDDVIINARQHGPDGLPEPLETPIWAFITERGTAQAAVEIMRAHFKTPDVAMQAHDANQAWKAENVTTFFQNKTAMNEPAQQWDDYERALRSWHIFQEDQGVEPAQIEAFDFSRVNVTEIDRGEDEEIER